MKRTVKRKDEVKAFNFWNKIRYTYNISHSFISNSITVTKKNNPIFSQAKTRTCKDEVFLKPKKIVTKGSKTGKIDENKWMRWK